MYGKANGCSRGRGGSMHLFDAGRRFYGGHAIVGGGLPVAVGLALADRMRGRPGVTACFFGEGAVAEGAFHESLNLAALWRLPVLFLCENNLYAMGTALDRHQAQADVVRKAEAQGVPGESLDGMDVLLVASAARRAVDAVRSGAGPRLLETRTYRFRAHSMYDPDLYRDKTEIEGWKRRDPIALFTRALQEARLVEEADLAALETSVTAEVAAAVAEAEAGPWEPVEDLLKDVYTGAARP
jgi:TPP-dependent pyruvate/acetoin dehydrogenase alpha subunit